MMSKKHLNQEIQNILDTLPENVQQDILEVLIELKNLPEDNLKLAHALRRIVAEDKELLLKLAQ